MCVKHVLLFGNNQQSRMSYYVSYSPETDFYSLTI